MDGAPALASARRAVLYGIGPNAVADAVATAGTALLRAPQPDAVLAAWLGQLFTGARPLAGGQTQPSAPVPLPPRRWDDAALAEFAAQSSTMGCECPRHVAELLQQVAQFETYSAECAHRSPADAALHAQLQQLAAGCRAQFEVALAQVAQHEGLLLPRGAQD